MLNTVAEVLDLRTEENLLAAFKQFELELVTTLRPLEDLLDKSIHTMDPAVNHQHATTVNSWRNRVDKYLMFMVALEGHAKSSLFLLPKTAGVTDSVREAHRRGISAPFTAWAGRLERLIDSIDNCVNLCKKCVASEENGRKSAVARSEF